jgi:uncharacterized membrane protein
MPDFFSIFVILILLMIVSIVSSIFSPFGLFFIIFSIIRGKTESSGLRTVSLFFQIALAILNLLAGILIGILFSIRGSIFYNYNEGIYATVAVILGVGLVFLISLGIIIWQSYKLREE